MDDTNVMIKCFIFSPHSVTWRTKLQYHAWDFNRNFSFVFYSLLL